MNDVSIYHDDLQVAYNEVLNKILEKDETIEHLQKSMDKRQLGELGKEKSIEELKKNYEELEKALLTELEKRNRDVEDLHNSLNEKNNEIDEIKDSFTELKAVIDELSDENYKLNEQIKTLHNHNVK